MICVATMMSRSRPGRAESASTSARRSAAVSSLGKRAASSRLLRLELLHQYRDLVVLFAE